MVKLAQPIHEQPAELELAAGLLLTPALLLAPVALLGPVCARGSPDDRGDRRRDDPARRCSSPPGRYPSSAPGSPHVAHDRLLRLAAADLVVTHGRDAIIETAIDAARAIGGTASQPRSTSPTARRASSSACHGPDNGVSRVVRERDLPRATRRALAAGTSAWLSPDEIDAVRVVLGLDRRHRRRLDRPDQRRAGPAGTARQCRQPVDP